MAIPVFLRDTFYLIENSTSEEIFKILKEEGIDSATLRGKATFQFPAASFDAVKSVIKSSLSSAQIAFYQAGESFFAMPITSVESLGYYKTDDGKLYASEQDYLMNKLSQSSKSVYNPEQENSVVINPELGDVISPENGQVISPESLATSTQVLNNTANDEKAETGVTPKKVQVRVKRGPIVKQPHRFIDPATSAALDEKADITMPKRLEELDDELNLNSEETVNGLQSVVSDFSTQDDSHSHEDDEPKLEQVLVPISQYRDEYTPEQKTFLENAEFLDAVLSSGKYHNIADHLLFYLDDVKRLMDVMGEEFEQEIKIPMLDEAYMSNFVEGSLPEGKFNYEVGESERLIDSMITLPVFSALLGKRNKSLQNKFSVTNLVGSKFARISVAGISANGALCGFAHFEEISNEAVAAAKKKVEEQLEATGKKFNSLTSQEKYELYLKEISDYYIKHKDCGMMLSAPNSSRYVDLSKALADMENQKFSVPEFYDSEQGMITWPRHEIISFDNRGEKTLLEQAKAVIKPTKVLVTEKAEEVIVNPELLSESEAVSSEKPANVVKTLPKGTAAEKKEVMVTPAVIQLPSSFEKSTEEVAEEAQVGNGLTASEIDNLLHTLVRSNVPVVPQKTSGITPGEKVITDSIKFSNTPSLINPIAYIDEQGHEWESEEAYKLAISSIGLSGDLLCDSPFELLDEEEEKVKGK